LRERSLGIKENPAAAQILNKSGYGSSVEMDGQGQMHFEPLRTTAFKTIGSCAHASSFPGPGGFTSSGDDSLTLSCIERRGKFQFGHLRELWKSV
jgi:hypothetical protein